MRRLKKCPHCGKAQLQRLMSAPVFRLKGGGWYETDFKSEQDNKRNLADRPEAEAPKEDKKEDKKETTEAASKDAAAPGAAQPAEKAAEKPAEKARRGSARSPPASRARDVSRLQRPSPRQRRRPSVRQERRRSRGARRSRRAGAESRGKDAPRGPDGGPTAGGWACSRGLQALASRAFPLQFEAYAHSLLRSG